jgi:thiol-disulfide isomerase/thioredoxin
MLLTLYSRSYCHLCDDMLAALRPLAAQAGCMVSIVDVDADEALVARYDALVPVLVAVAADGSVQQLCHHFLDVAAVRRLLALDS